MHTIRYVVVLCGLLGLSSLVFDVGWVPSSLRRSR